VCHRTATVACPVPISFLFWHRRPLQLRARWRTEHCPVHTRQSGAHRTVRCPLPTVGAATRRPLIARLTAGAGDRWLTGQSGAPPDSPVNYSRTPSSSPKSSLFTRTSLGHRILSGAPPDSPVCQAEPDFGCTQPSLLQLFSFLLFSVSNT
jgi:hypothetical protein